MNFITLADMNPIWITVIIIAAFGLIALIAYIIHRVLTLRLKKKEEEVTEEEIARENLDRYLEPVEDETLAKEISEYKDEEDQ